MTEIAVRLAEKSGLASEKVSDTNALVAQKFSALRRSVKSEGRESSPNVATLGFSVQTADSGVGGR